MAVAGTVGIAGEPKYFGQGLVSFLLPWVSDGNGAVSGLPVNLPAGTLVSAKATPGSGSAQPTDKYDVLLVDAEGYDVLLGQGVDLPNAEPAVLQWDPPLPFHGGTLEVQASNAGSAKSGTLELFIASVGR